MAGRVEEREFCKHAADRLDQLKLARADLRGGELEDAVEEAVDRVNRLEVQVAPPAHGQTGGSVAAANGRGQGVTCERGSN